MSSEDPEIDPQDEQGEAGSPTHGSNPLNLLALTFL